VALLLSSFFFSVPLLCCLGRKNTLHLIFFLSLFPRREMAMMTMDDDNKGGLAWGGARLLPLSLLFFLLLTASGPRYTGATRLLVASVSLNSAASAASSFSQLLERVHA
jgi:hypothetical protein